MTDPVHQNSARVERVTRGGLTERRLLAGRAGGAWATTVMVNRHAVVLTGGRAPGLRMWDPATGDSSMGRVLPPPTGRGGQGVSLTVAVVDGRPVAVTGGDDRTVRGRDLAR